MKISCYLRRNIVYLPTVGEIEPGFYREDEPIAVIAVADTAGLRNAFGEIVARGNPRVPNLLRGQYPKPAILKHAKVRSFGEFARGAQTWAIEQNAKGTRIIGYRRAQDRGWEPDPEQTVTLSPEQGIDGAIERLIAILQAKAAE